MKTAPSFQPVVELSLPAHLRANGSHLDSWMKTMYGLIERKCDPYIFVNYNQNNYKELIAVLEADKYMPKAASTEIREDLFELLVDWRDCAVLKNAATRWAIHMEQAYAVQLNMYHTMVEQTYGCVVGHNFELRGQLDLLFYYRKWVPSSYLGDAMGLWYNKPSCRLDFRAPRRQHRISADSMARHLQFQSWAVATSSSMYVREPTPAISSLRPVFSEDVKWFIRAVGIEQDRLIWDCYQHYGFPDTKSPRSLSNLGYSKALSSFSPSI